MSIICFSVIWATQDRPDADAVSAGGGRECRVWGRTQAHASSLCFCEWLKNARNSGICFEMALLGGMKDQERINTGEDGSSGGLRVGPEIGGSALAPPGAEPTVGWCVLRTPRDSGQATWV